MNPIRVFCVDDNRLLAQAMERLFVSETAFVWAGWMGETGDIVEAIIRAAPDVVLLDIDLPGQQPFGIVRHVARLAPGIRVLMFSGHVRRDYLERALDSGAWGYVSKSDAMGEILAAIRRVAGGEFVVSPDARRECLPNS